MRQFRLKFVGELYESFVVALPLLSAVQFMSILIVLYDSVKEYLLPIMPWITLQYFFGMVVAVLLIGMATVYLFVVPSIWNFRQKQMGELVQKIEGLQAQLVEIQAQLPKGEA